MDEENKKFRRKVILISVFVVVMFLGFAGVMVKMIIENGKCVDDPFRYAAQKLNDSGGSYSCRCTSLDPKLLDFEFSAENGIEIINPNQNYFNLEDFNFSSIEVKGGNE